MKKRLLSLALALCMALALLPTAALAADSEFVIENGVLVEYTGDGGDVVIPDGVTSIGNRAFYQCDNLTGVTIPSSVTSIGDEAFYYCSNLTNMTIPDSITTIGDYAFFYCIGLSSITIPDSVTSFGTQAFAYCANMKSLTISNSVTRIEKAAFFQCASLTSVTIPDSVTSIGDGAFFRCTDLTSVTIPDSVITIGDHAFKHTNLTSVTIPSSVTRIENEAFCECVLMTSVTIPDSVISIGEYAFDVCTKLTDVYYGGSEADWSKISIGNENDCLLNATFHYNTSMPSVSTEPSVPIPAVGGFSDVHEGDFYDDAVLWAVENGITNGTSGTTFSPNDTCSRAQVVTFLHRALNEPESSASNPFTDVNTSDYYGDAVLWAVENEVTGGTGGTNFSPNASCSRAQVVTFLYRAMGSPDVSGSGSSFTDVPSGEFYTDAVAWAVTNGITSGTSATTFSPNDICSRAQVVTFLYRALV